MKSVWIHELKEFGVDECSSLKMYIETINLSFNQLNNDSISSPTFFKCLKSRELFLNNNSIDSFSKDWQFFDESLRMLDLKYNKIEKLEVSFIFSYSNCVLYNTILLILL